MFLSWRYWHKVLGLTLGVVLLVVTLSGGILVFKEDLIALNVPPENEAVEYDIDRIATGLQRILTRHSAESIYYLKTPGQGRHYWLVALKNDEVLLYDSAAVQLLDDRWRVMPVLHWLNHFHTELLLPKSGTTWLTLLGLATLVMLIAGLVSWWPGRRGFRLSHLWLWPSRRGLALRQHRAVAIVCLPLLVLSILTGGGMSIQGALRYLFVEEPSVPPVTELISAPAPAASASDLEQLLHRAQSQLPDAQITMLGLPSASRPEMRVRFRLPGEWHVNGKTAMRIDTHSGEIAFARSDQMSTGKKILNTFYPLHSSYGLPPVYKGLVALTGLLTMVLVILGWIAWLKRRNGGPTRI